MKNLSRTILALAIMVSLLFSLGVSAFAAEFTDMPTETHWAYKALNEAVENKLLNGDNNMLRPESNLKRAEMAAIINRAFGAAQSADISAFKDVPKTAWFYADIEKAVKMGTFEGDGAGIMRPESPITRQEAFIVLARAIKLMDGDAVVLDKFSDKDLVAEWAKKPLAAMVAAGYVNGADGKLNPTSTISRQEFAQVMYNTFKAYISKSGTVTEVPVGNVMVNTDGVTLKNVNIKGDLIVGDGVGDGDFILDNVNVTGRLVVRGGGKNSIRIINGSAVGNIVVNKTADGAVRIVADSSSSVEVVYVADGNDAIIVEGSVNTLTIAGTTEVEIKGTVNNVVITEEATSAEITVASGATVTKLETKAPNVKIVGEGKITKAKVGGDKTTINVPGTNVVVDEGVVGTNLNGKNVDGGTETVVPDDNTSGGGGGTPDATNYKAEIEGIISQGSDYIISALNNEITIGITPTTNGGNIAISYPSSFTATYINVGLVVDEIRHIIKETNLDISSQYITGTKASVSSVVAGGKTLNVDNNFSPSAIKEFIYGMSYTYNGEIKKISRDSLTAELPETYSVQVTAKNGITYTYTISRSVLQA